MVLSSSAYFIFLVGIFFLYWPVARVRALSLGVILFANYFFYAKWDLFYLALIPAASTCDYLIALGAAAQQEQPSLRRALVTLSVLMNLGHSGVVQVHAVFPRELYALLGTARAGMALDLPARHLFLRVPGADLHDRPVPARRQGDLELSGASGLGVVLPDDAGRADHARLHADPQFEKKDKALSAADGGRALFLIGMGLIKKLLIADYLADNLVNRVFDFPKLYTGAETLIAVYAYALQIYYDFSGYTDIAIGSALLLGIKLPPNFNMPYAAENIADFWRRWHITLSNWLRDYLYFSLPGLRSKWKIFTYLNLIITMVLGGLWHGASWNFVIWGLLHGVGLAVDARLADASPGTRRPRAAGGAWRAASSPSTSSAFTWIFFRAPTLDAALNILSRIGSLTVSFDNISAPVALVLAIAVVAHYFPKKW